MGRNKARPEVLERHRTLLGEALEAKGLSHRPLVELFGFAGHRGASHSGGSPAFSEEEGLLFADYDVRSGQELSEEKEAWVRTVLDRTAQEKG